MKVEGAASKIIGHRIDRGIKRAKRRAAARRKTEAFRRALYFERLRRKNIA